MFVRKHTKRMRLGLRILLLRARRRLLGLRREHVGLCVAEGRAVHQTLLVHLVLHDRRRVQTQDLTELVADARERRVRTVPNADHVLLVATGHHHANHIRILEGLADRSEHLKI